MEGGQEMSEYVHRLSQSLANGFRRTQFTNADEEHLCEWIAAKIPYKETGGRTGNRIYQQLCDMVRNLTRTEDRDAH